MTSFEYSGGALCLDFANTWGNRADAASDRLGEYGDIVAWAEGAGALSSRERSVLDAAARRRVSEAREVFESAVELREAIFRICAATAAGNRPPDGDVAMLNGALAEVPTQELCCGGPCCEWRWPEGTSDLRRVLWPVVQSAAALVTGPEIGKVRQCAAADCNWLFVDRSRGNRRRWCDMSSCGNRAKARRYYERHRAKP